MWFKNLRFYRLDAGFEAGEEALAEAMEGQRFRPCGSLQPMSLGWVAPMPALSRAEGGEETGPLVHVVNGCFLLCARKEERVLPAAVVNEALNLRIKEIELEESRQVRRKEKQEIKEQLVQELLPRAFTRSKRYSAYLAPGQRLLVADAATASLAEELLSLLREGLGSLPARPLKVLGNPSEVMTGWLERQECHPGFSLGDECELVDPALEGGTVRCRRQDLAAEEIQSHLQAGKKVRSLALIWEERLSGILTEELAVKRLKFLDLVKEESSKVAAEEAAARFDADFSLMTLELQRWLPVLIQACGGEEAPVAQG